MTKNYLSETHKKIAQKVLTRYLNSDFNGTMISTIADEFGGYTQAKKYIKELVNANVLELICANNPHIKGFDFSKQQPELLSKLDTLSDNLVEDKILIGEIEVSFSNNYGYFAVYPTVTYIKKNIVNKIKYYKLPPFTQMLSFGMPCFEDLYFRIDVLDRYIEDPRYNVRYDDFTGNIIFISDEENKEQLYLKHFGLGHNANTKENLICVWARDLSKIEDRHQYHFYSYMEQKTVDIVPDYDYFRTQIMGEFAERASIYSAFFEEIKVINKMSNAICGKSLFKKEYSDEDRKNLECFHPFLKPTVRVLENFCKTLDKIFTDNLSKETILEIYVFSGSEMSDDLKSDKLGTLVLLENLIRVYFHPCGEEDIVKKIIDIWKKS